MEILDKIFTESQVNEVSEKILASVKEKIKEEIANEFYKDTEEYIYQVYDNAKNKIKDELISEITERYVKEPSDYKFKDLREKMWSENRSEILTALTDEAIKASLSNIMLGYTNESYVFNWKWKDEIVSFILSNWDSFKDDERINAAFGRELSNKQYTINRLNQQLQEIKNAVE